jgi:hypothetical protein
MAVGSRGIANLLLLLSFYSKLPRPMRNLTLRILQALSLCCIGLLITHAARSQWRPAYLGTDSTDNTYGMYFLTPSTGFVAFDKFIGFTQDSGKTFVHRPITLSNVDYNGYSVGLTLGFAPKGIVAFSTDSLLVYGHFSFEPSILFSADQGQTWKLVYHQYIDLGARVPSGGVTDMKFPGNGNMGFAVHNEEIIRTMDRGQHWQTMITLPLQQLRKLSFPSTTIGYVSGAGYVLKTTTSGTYWDQAGPAGVQGTPNFKNIFFTSVTDGYVMDDASGAVYRTTDGAASWTKMNDPSVVPIGGNDLCFVNDSTGFTASEYQYQVWKTTNYGRTWEPCKNSSSYQFHYYGTNSLFFSGTQAAWAGADGEYLMINTSGSPTLPKAYFKIDTTGLSQTDSVKLINYSNTGYSYRWYRNDTLIGTGYNLEYAHDLFRLMDTVKLIVSNGTDTDTLTSYTGFPPPVLVYSFTPTGGASGAVITIRGTGFTGATSVSFGGVGASRFTVISDSVISAIVSNGDSGSVVVRGPTGVGSLAGFAFWGPPKIDLPIQVADSIVCKSGPVSLTLQNTEAGVRYTLLDSLGNAYGSATGNAGAVVLNSNPVSVTGNYSIMAVNTGTGVSAMFTRKIFFLVEHPHSGFATDKINVVAGEPVQYFSRCTGAASFQWTFDEDASVSASTLAVVPGVLYGSEGQKTLKLISTSVNGCPDTVTGNAVFVYSPMNPSTSCYVSAMDRADTVSVIPNQTWGDLSPAPGGGFMICATGNQTVANGRVGASVSVPSGSSVYANYSANGVLRFTDYVTQGAITSSAVDAADNIYLTGYCNSSAYFHFANGDSMQIYVADQERDELWSKVNGFIIKLDQSGNYVWHTILWDPTRVYSGNSVQGGLGAKIRVFGGRVMVLGSFLAGLDYVRNGVLTPLYALTNTGYPQDMQNEFILDIDTAGAFHWSAYLHFGAVNWMYSLAGVGMDANGNTYYDGNFEGYLQLHDAANGLTGFGGEVASSHGYMIKLDPAGHRVWSTRVDNAFNYREVGLNDIAVDSAGSSYFIGNTLLGDTSQYFTLTNSDSSVVKAKLSGWFVGRMNSGGILQWVQGTLSAPGATSYALTLADTSLFALGSYVNFTFTDYPVTITSGGGGVARFNTTGSELFLARYTTSGVLQRVNRSGGNFEAHLFGRGIFVDNNGNIVLAGTTDNYNAGGYHYGFFGDSLTARSANVWFGKLNPAVCMADSSVAVDAGPDAAICFGDSARLGVGLAGNGTIWSSALTGFISDSVSPVVHPAATTTYYLSRSDADGLVSWDSMQVFVHGLVNYAGSNATICIGNTDTLGITSAASGGGANGGGGGADAGIQYLWSSVPGSFSSSSPRPVVRPQVTTVYSVRTLDSLGCKTIDTVTVTVKTNSLASFGVTDTAICAGQSVLLGRSPDNADKWVWHSDPAGFGSSSSSPEVTPAVNTTYFAAISGAYGCAGGDTVVVRVKALPAEPQVSLKDSATLMSTQGMTYQWYMATVAIAGADQQLYQPLASGLYSVVVTDSGCASPPSAIFDYVMPLPPPPPAPGDTTWVNIGPNPAGNLLYIRFHATGVEMVNVQIIDLDGQVVLRQANVTSGGAINVSAMQRGVYTVRIWDDSGKIGMMRELLKL